MRVDCLKIGSDCAYNLFLTSFEVKINVILFGFYLEKVVYLQPQIAG
ncbi:hypothetical protein T190130A13A_20681 [Tenacibaculum sp. 190130A14a]|uniref:Uncharacterized protein n=1 Tax=Tenacibaculum polynesiense TaxID=3137857 RepID=A0ABP1F1H6_9FLAO